jgi:phosphohistidine phosphatase
MEIYVLRHGIAAAGQPDSDRALTKEGREKLAAVLACARRAKVQPSLILTSPLVRALETAEMAAQVLAPKVEIARSDALKPGSSPERVWEEVSVRKDEPSVMLVGHEPLLGETISFLLGSARAIVDLKKGAMARIEVENITRRPSGVLMWLLTPRLAQAES